jgi:hypothetical protein
MYSQLSKIVSETATFNFGHLVIRTPYIHVRKDVRTRGYFRRQKKRVREQSSLGNTALAVAILSKFNVASSFIAR